MDTTRRQSAEGKAPVTGFSFNHARLATHVAAYIRDLMMSGHLARDEKLSIVPLAEQIGVSTTPVREALLLLETEGLVRSEPRRGFYVVPLSLEDVQDLFELHAVVAGRLAARAAEVSHADKLGQLVQLDEKIKESAVLGDGQLVEELNFQFHRTINHMAPSPILRRFLAQTSRYIPRRYYADIPGWTEASVTEHAPILDGLRRGDANMARIAVEEHIRRAGVLLASYLCDQGLIDRPDQNRDGTAPGGEGVLRIISSTGQ